MSTWQGCIEYRLNVPFKQIIYFVISIKVLWGDYSVEAGGLIILCLKEVFSCSFTTFHCFQSYLEKNRCLFLSHLWFRWLGRDITSCAVFYYSVSAGGFNFRISLYENLKIVQTSEICSSLEKALQPYQTSPMTGKYFRVRVCALCSPDQLQWHIRVFWVLWASRGFKFGLSVRFPTF